MKKKIPYILWIVLTAAFLTAGCAKHTQYVSFAVVADIQYADKDSTEWYYRQTLNGLQQFVQNVNQQKPDFAIELGDIIDGGAKAEQELDRILGVYHQLKCPKYYVLGNHEFNGLSRDVVLAKLNLPTGYYCFTRGSFRFVILDTVELNKQNAAAAEQLTWLDKTLNDAAERKLNVIVFGHYPLLPEGDFRSPPIRVILEKYGCVRAYLCGHNHFGGYVLQNGIHYVTLPAMVDSPDGMTWAMMTAYPDRLMIKGTGKILDETFYFSNTITKQ